MTLTTWTINASFLLMVVWMQRHKRWHTFTLAMKGAYGIKTGTYKGTSSGGYQGPGSVITTAPTLLHTITTSVHHPSRIFTTGPEHVWTHIKHLF